MTSKKSNYEFNATACRDSWEILFYNFLRSLKKTVEVLKLDYFTRSATAQEGQLYFILV